MPPSFHVGFLEYLNKQRWSQAMAGHSSREGMAVQVGPDGNFPPDVTCSPF